MKHYKDEWLWLYQLPYKLTHRAKRSHIRWCCGWCGLNFLVGPSSRHRTFYTLLLRLQVDFFQGAQIVIAVNKACNFFGVLNDFGALTSAQGKYDGVVFWARPPIGREPGFLFSFRGSASCEFAVAENCWFPPPTMPAKHFVQKKWKQDFDCFIAYHFLPSRVSALATFTVPSFCTRVSLYCHKLLSLLVLLPHSRVKIAGLWTVHLDFGGAKFLNSTILNIGLSSPDIAILSDLSRLARGILNRPLQLLHRSFFFKCPSQCQMPSHQKTSQLVLWFPSRCAVLTSLITLIQQARFISILASHCPFTWQLPTHHAANGLVKRRRPSSD